MDLVDKYLITEKSNVIQQLRFFKDIMIIMQDIYDTKQAKMSPEEKQQRINKNVELIRYLLNKHNVQPLYREMAVAGLQAALAHAGHKGRVKIR